MMFTSALASQRSRIFGQASFLGLQSCRRFSTIEPKIFSNAVFMPDIFPARLAIPTNGGAKYEFTCEDQTSVADFRQLVLDNT